MVHGILQQHGVLSFGEKLQTVIGRTFYKTSELHKNDDDDEEEEVHAYGKMFKRR
jgi:hypothetical protein